MIKDGRSTANGLSVTDTPKSELIRLMTGRDVANVFPQRKPVPADAPVVLDVDNLELHGHFEKVSLTVRAENGLGLC